MVQQYKAGCSDLLKPIPLGKKKVYSWSIGKIIMNLTLLIESQEVVFFLGQFALANIKVGTLKVIIHKCFHKLDNKSIQCFIQPVIVSHAERKKKSTSP